MAIRKTVDDETQVEHNELLAETIAYIKAGAIFIYQARIAIVRDPAATKSGLIHIPDEVQIKQTRGTVVALGRGMADVELDPGMAVGDHVLYTKYGGVVHKVVLPSGTEVELELVSYVDIYIGWEGK